MSGTSIVDGWHHGSAQRCWTRVGCRTLDAPFRIARHMTLQKRGEGLASLAERGVTFARKVSQLQYFNALRF
jgi:hypothetical protein